ncbi:MAG: OmpA family protein [Bacteroidales bacterium]|nr:OmpA family protein [Candidatus Latescibacterota bacterium]
MNNICKDRISGMGAILMLLLVLIPVFSVAPAYAQSTPAGTSITARSMVSYETSGNHYIAYSNEVSTGVIPVFGPILLPDGTALAPAAEETAFSGETVTFPFTLGNTGNAGDIFALTIDIISPSGFIPENVMVYLDVDSDGEIDIGENVVTEVGPLEIAETVSLILSAGLPPGLTGGETAHLDLTARSAGDTSLVDRDNVVRIVTRDEARVSLQIESDRPDVPPGEIVTWTLNFENAGERAASDIVITDFIDYTGMGQGTEYVTGSFLSSLTGLVEYFDIDLQAWVEIAPPAERVKGIRLSLATMAPGADGFFSFAVRVSDDHEWGDIFNAASTEYTGGDAQLYTLDSNEITVIVLQVSSLLMGPLGNPDAEEGSLEDRIVIALGATDTTCTFWHEVRSTSNFIDTVQVVLADSTVIPGDWDLEFVDGSGSPLDHDTRFIADIGPVESGGSRTVGLRLSASPERFRSFQGRELEFAIESRSLVDPSSRNGVRDVLVKSDMPLLSVKQSIREPNAMVGDILSYIVTIENMTEETTVDSIMLVESVSAGLGYAGGSEEPEINGNTFRWELGSLGPGEKKEVIFRAAVKAGQERDEIVSMAWVFGVSTLGERTSDGPAVASIRIIEGIFSRKGLLFGRVFLDTDNNGIPSAKERGVRGVSVFMENGTYAVTDSTGSYSIPSVLEGRHVLRVDPKTLPDSLETGEAGYFGFGISGEYLIDLAPSGNRRVDFPLRSVTRQTGGDSFAAIEGSGPVVAGSALNNTGGQLPGGSDAAGSSAADSSALDDEVAADDPQESDATDFDGYRAITFPSSHFEPGGAILEEIPIREVAALGLWIMEHPDWTISISGHSDNVPINTAEYPSNFELSLARARSVFQVLRMNGIDDKIMDYMGYGSRSPIASNDTEEGRAANRRVEIKVNPPEGYDQGDPDIPSILSRPDTTEKTYSLADDAGICAEIVGPDEGHIFTMRDKIDIEVLSPLASSVELYVNNIPVGREKIGQKQIDVGNGTIGYIFYDVKIVEGRNDILVVCRSHGEKNVCVRHVYLSGRPAGIVAEREKVRVQADGTSSPEIVFLVNDKSGLPVRDGLFVNVTGPDELISGLDVNPHQQGVQAGTKDGRVRLELPPSRDPRREKISVNIDDLSATCGISYDSPMRDWFLFGYGEGDLGYSSLSGTGSTDRSAVRHHDGLYVEGKFSLYGQGEVATGHLMTLSIDSRPVREDRLLGRIDPEKPYPVYGDASELKFNSASRSGTYIKMDHRKYSAMFGDYETALGGGEFTNYNRTFNGLRGEFRHSKGEVKSFVTRTDQATFQEEIRADGTSGFYFLGHYPLIQNSEKIRIEVRDRYRPETIVRVDYKQYGRDYDINYMDGSILFKEPVASVDMDLNPVMIVISYECRDIEDVNFIYGIRSSFDLTDSLKTGATVILEEEGSETSSIIGIDLSGRLLPGVSIESEYAHSKKFLLGSGDAFRIRLLGRHSCGVKWNTYYRNIDSDFFNPSFTGGKTELGSMKTGIDLDWGLSKEYSIVMRTFMHDFRELSEEKRYLDIRGVRRSKEFSASTGFAGASHSDDRDGSQTSALWLGSVAYEKDGTKAELQVDQKVAGEEVDEYPNRIQARLSQKLWRHISGTFKHEYRSGRRSGARHLTQLGVESNLTDDLNMYSRYRMEGAVSGERGQAVMGLKNRFRLGKDLSGTFTAEKTSTVTGVATDDFTALATGWIYTPKENLYKLKGDYEVRFEPDRIKHLLGLAGLRRIGMRWAGLLKGDLWYSNEELELDRVKGNGTLGLSFRPKDAGPLTLFSLMKTTYEKNSPAHPGAVDKNLMIMTEANYLLGRSWELEGKLGGRWVKNTFKSYTASTASFLYQLQAIRKIGSKWDVTFASRIVHQSETGTVRFGGGLQLGRVVAENVWVGCGYDFGGHRDADAPINDFNRSGFHFGMKMKFNEKILEHFHD